MGGTAEMIASYRKLLLAKIHGATVTEANLHYEGSITIPTDYLAATGLLPHEAVQVWNVTRGTRLETYILEGTAGSKEFHINGAAAHLVHKGDKIIIAAFTYLEPLAAATHKPTTLFLNPDNSIKDIHTERPKTFAV
jgi:aspartate 1-decarboxylase